MREIMIDNFPCINSRKCQVIMNISKWIYKETITLFKHCEVTPIRMLSPQRDLRYNVGGSVNTLTQMGTTCALVLLVNVTRPSLQYGKG